MKKRDLALGFGAAVGAMVAWKMLTRPDTVDWQKNARLIEHSEHSDFIEVDGIRIHFQEFGDQNAPPLVLVHGFTASTYVWKTVAPMLAAEGFRVIAPDLPGFGLSAKPGWFDYSIGSHARVLLRFLDLLGLGNVTMVGSSYGGAVAMWLALDYPERIQKLVLVDGVSNNDAKRHPVLRLAEVPGIGEVITPFLLDSKRFLRFRMQNTIDPTNHDLITNERIASVQGPISAADGHRSVLLTSRNWDARRLEKDAYLIRQPTLLIWGENDRVIPLSNAERLYDTILNSRLVVLRNCGHIPQEEKPDIFTSLVSEFSRDSKGRLEERQEAELILEQVKLERGE